MITLLFGDCLVTQLIGISAFWEKNDKVLLKFSPLPQKRKFYEVLRPLTEMALSTTSCTSVISQRAF